MKTFSRDCKLKRLAPIILCLLTWCARGMDTLDEWHWRNPYPTGNIVSRIAFLNGQFVGLTTKNEIVVSTNGTNWTLKTLAIEGTFNQIAYGNGHYVMGIGRTNSSALVAVSSDLNNWTLLNPGTTNKAISTVIFGNNLFMALDDKQNVFSSTNGLSWNSIPGVQMGDIIYGNGKYIGLNSNHALVSSDTTNWTSTVVVTNGNLVRISFANGRFYATGYQSLSGGGLGGTTSSSADGVTWIKGTDYRSSGYSESVMVFGNGSLLGASFSTFTSPLGISSNGIDFTRLTPVGFTLTGDEFSTGLHPDLAFGNNLFVSPTLQTSSDGTNWSQTSGFYLTTDLIRVPTGYIMICNQLLFSSNGLEFTLLTNTLPASIDRVASGNGLFHGVGLGTVLRSTNGLDWESRNPATTQRLNDITYGNSTWVAVGNNGTITTSSTGNAWSLRTSGTSLALYGIVYGQSQFLAVGDSGTILTSPDGINWTAQYSGTSQRLYKVTYGNGRYIAVGITGTVITSSNGIDWTTGISGTSIQLDGVAYGDGYFCATGIGVALTSTDGLTWQERHLPSTTPKFVRFFDGTFFAFAANQLVQSGPVIPVSLKTQRTNNLTRVTIDASPNLLLQMQSSDDLAIGSWVNRDLITNSAEGSVTFKDDSSANQTHRFYRAVAP